MPTISPDQLERLRAEAIDSKNHWVTLSTIGMPAEVLDAAFRDAKRARRAYENALRDSQLRGFYEGESALRAWRVRWNADKFQPTSWSGSKVRLFGERNEGALVEATSAAEAVELFAAAQKPALNPSYLIAVSE
jgi:hypothetical protein